MGQQNDELRYRFTAWMKVVVTNAKIDYIRRQNRHSNEISIENDKLADTLTYEPINEFDDLNGFNFDNGNLFAAFKKLTPKRKQVLELLYVRNLTPEEITVELQCSLQYVYNLRSLAIKELKTLLGMGE